MPQTNCTRCGAQYASERELRDHFGTAHRKFWPEQSSSEPGNTPFELPAAAVNPILKQVLTEDQEHMGPAPNGTPI